MHPVKFLSKATVEVKHDAEGYPYTVTSNRCLDAKKANEWQKKIEEALSMPDFKGGKGGHSNPQDGSKYHPLIDGCNPNGNNEVIK